MADEIPMTEPEVEAGANALAIRHFIDGRQWPLSRFPENMQDAFREKARAVLDAGRQDIQPEIDRLRAWLSAIGNLADVDADERGWMVEHALAGKAAPDV